MFYVADACRWYLVWRRQDRTAEGGAVGFERIGMSTTALECHGRTGAQSMIQPVEASYTEHVPSR